MTYKELIEMTKGGKITLTSVLIEYTPVAAVPSATLMAPVNVATSTTHL